MENMFKDMCIARMQVKELPDYQLPKINKSQLNHKLQCLENTLREWERHVETTYNEEDELNIDSLIAYYDNQYNEKGHENDPILYRNILNMDVYSVLQTEAKTGFSLSNRIALARQLYGEKNKKVEDDGLYWWIEELDAEFSYIINGTTATIGEMLLSIPRTKRNQLLNKRK